MVMGAIAGDMIGAPFEGSPAFLESHEFESAVRNAILLGGDADTMACIAGSIAEAFYGGAPPAVQAEVGARLSPDLAVVLTSFTARFGGGGHPGAHSVHGGEPP